MRGGVYYRAYTQLIFLSRNVRYVSLPDSGFCPPSVTRLLDVGSASESTLKEGRGEAMGGTKVGRVSTLIHRAILSNVLGRLSS